MASVVAPADRTPHRTTKVTSPETSARIIATTRGRIEFPISLS